jgi:16S rRNA (cytosine967-C5)-methyltransferase
MKLSGAGGLERLSAWREGLFQIQDPASRLAVLAAAPEPGFRVIDGCAAPGGKSFAAAMEMKNRGSILSCDIYPSKLETIREGAGRLGISVLETALLDASKTEPSLVGTADLVLSDVPCSGMGVIRKKPDIRYKDPASLKTLPSLQPPVPCAGRKTKPWSAPFWMKPPASRRSPFVCPDSGKSRAAYSLSGPTGTAPTGFSSAA